MNERCPHCGLKFEREQGYFLGAMYFSYGIATVVIVLLAVLVWAVRTKQFSNQDEARYLPLRAGAVHRPSCGIPGAPSKRENEHGSGTPPLLATEARHVAP